MHGGKTRSVSSMRCYFAGEERTPMDKRDLRLNQWEVELQCQIALLSEERIRPAYAELLKTDPIRGVALFWMPLQPFLNTYANISKLLWGSGRARRARQKAHVVRAFPLRPGC
jgi:hypothetical protein